MSKVVKAYQDLGSMGEWGERAAFNAARLLKTLEPPVSVANWGVSSNGTVCWLTLESGEVGYDIALTKEFYEFHGFRDQKDKFLSFAKRQKPAAFSQNGVGRFIYSLDLEDPEGVTVEYEGDEPFRDFTKVEEEEAAELKAKSEEWDVAEKARKAAAKNAG